MSQDRIKRFYDRFGEKQDKQDFYEGAALEVLVRHGRFEEAQSVLEVGCGTGKFASRLLTDHLPNTAHYVGIDISSTMVSLAEERVAPWQERAHIFQSSGSFDLSSYGSQFDRVIFTYVLDLLSEQEIADALAGAHAALCHGGLLCCAGLTNGASPLSRATSTLWKCIYRVNPYLVGGCRPLELANLLATEDWRIVFSEKVVSMAIPSEVVIAGAV